MAECPMCRGTGLVGSGDQPHLHIGQVKGCPNCAGTGKVDDIIEAIAEEISPVEVVEEVVEAPVVETEPVAPVEESVSVDSAVVEAPAEGATLEVASEPVQ